MLSRAGQNTLRAATPPSTPTPRVGLSKGSETIAASIDAALASMLESSGPGASLGEPKEVVAGTETQSTGTEEMTVRRKLKNGSRSLTVDCSQRLIGDMIQKASNSERNLECSCVSKQHPAQAIQTPGVVASVWGSETTSADKFVPFFAQKSIHFDGDISKMRHCIGLVSHRGHKPESPNQDDFFVLSRPESLLFGVLDGHGPEGHNIAHFAQERLPTKITERLRQNGEAWEEAISVAVSELCTEAKAEVPQMSRYSGSTVSIAMLDQTGSEPGGPMRLRCGYLGDSIVISAKRKSKGAAWEVTELTDIHRPDREDEAARIENSGGTVQPSTGPGVPSRLLTPEWNLAMSRSFGDFHATSYGLSSIPQISPEVILEPGYEHVILACSDGVWDVIPAAQAVQFVAKFKPEEAQLAAERLVAKAQLRWQEMFDVVDDITAIVVWPGFEASGTEAAEAA